ncbi:MAG: DNA-methyltransferase [Phycisphaerales bacterium]
MTTSEPPSRPESDHAPAVELVWNGKSVDSGPHEATPVRVVERFGEGDPNRLIQGDLRGVMPVLSPGSVDFAYLDPPFASGQRRQSSNGLSYDDRWDLEKYLGFLHESIRGTHRALRPHGVIALHTDHRASAYARLILDEVFGRDAFVNELIWKYGLGNARTRRSFLRKHDTIAVYAKGPDYHFEMQRGVVTRPQEKKYCHKDERGRYMMSYGRKYYLKGGKPLESVLDIPALSATDGERTGYPTQKPIRLLEVLIRSFCPPDGMVLDPCCGSGATAAAAQRLGRRWIAIDANGAAIQVCRRRFASMDASFTIETSSSSEPRSEHSHLDASDDWAVGRFDSDDVFIALRHSFAPDQYSPDESSRAIDASSDMNPHATVLRRWNVQGEPFDQPIPRRPKPPSITAPG